MPAKLWKHIHEHQNWKVGREMHRIVQSLPETRTFFSWHWSLATQAKSFASGRPVISSPGRQCTPGWNSWGDSSIMGVVVVQFQPNPSGSGPKCQCCLCRIRIVSGPSSFAVLLIHGMRIWISFVSGIARHVDLGWLFSVGQIDLNSWWNYASNLVFSALWA